MSTVLRLIAVAVWGDEESTVPVLLIFALLGLVASVFAAFHGIEMADL